MIVYILLLPLIAGVALLFGTVALGRWFLNANPTRLAGHVRSGGSLALALLGLLLMARGQVRMGSGLFLAGLGLFRSAGGGGAAGFQGFGGFGGMGGMGGMGGARSRGAPREGQSSTVRTEWLEARLDHDSGQMDAEVLAGRHRGRTFSAMATSDVLEVWRECGADEESRLVVEAYLDRRHPEWREDAQRDGDRRTGGAHGAGSSGAMTVNEAYEVLGLEAGASEAEIRTSHRRLMKQMHPDQGGSSFFAARLNEARDVLLGKR